MSEHNPLSPLSQEKADSQRLAEKRQPTRVFHPIPLISPAKIPRLQKSNLKARQRQKRERGRESVSQRDAGMQPHDNTVEIRFTRTQQATSKPSISTLKMHSNVKKYKYIFKFTPGFTFYLEPVVLFRFSLPKKFPTHNNIS